MPIQSEAVHGMMAAMRCCDPSHKWDGFPVLADALEECDGRLVTENVRLFDRMRRGAVTPYDVREIEEMLLWPLSGYSWKEAFAYAGEPSGIGEPAVSEAVPGSGVPTTPFRRSHVAEVAAHQEGENDGPSWLCVGRLTDGRWFALKAWCDYTGWDCQANGEAAVAATKDDVIRYGLTSEERVRLQVAIPELDGHHTH